MKQLYSFFFNLLLLMLGTGYAARAQATYSQVPLTAGSFTADVIANGTAAVAPASVPTTGTNQDVDGGSYYFISQDYNTATASHTSGIPNGGAIPNAIAGYSALTYQLAPFTGNNSLRIPATGTTQTTGSGTATFATPTAAAEVYVLVTGGSAGTAGITVNMTVTYADNTTTTFTAQPVPDWYTASTALNVFGMTARANSTAAVIPAAASSPGTAPFFDQVKLTIPPGKVTSAIKSITFDKTSTAGFLHVFAVSIGTYPVCTAAPTTQAQATTTSGGSTALTTACSSTSIYLSLSGLPTYSGYTYQWQSSPSNSTWTSISGATSSTYTATGQMAATYYRCLVYCLYDGGNGSTATPSASVQVGQNAFDACYCAPTSSSGCGTYGIITSVAITGTSLSNSPGCIGAGSTGYSAAYYANYATAGSPTATLAPNTTYTITGMVGRSTRAYLWLDYDHSGTFDSGEATQIAYNTTTSAAAYSTTFTVPAGALAGSTRMRIRSDYYSYATITAATSTAACTSTTYGESLDYLVTIAPPTACAGTPPAITLASSSGGSVCSNAAFTLAASGPAAGTTGLSYQFQSSPAGAGTFSNLGGAQAAATYSVSSQAAATDYRVLVTCASSNLSSLSNVVSVSQNSFLSCYCTPVTSGLSTDGITKVVLTTPAGTLTNSSSTTNSSPYYTDYSAAQTAGTLPIPTLYGGGTATLAITMGADPNQYSGAWIDFDHSGTFDTGEFFTAGTNAGSNGTSTFTISVPAGALAGQTKLRVRGGDDVVLLNTQSCTAASSASNYGEVEDYLVSIATPVPCTGTPAATLAAASASAVCAGVSFNLSATGIVAGTTGLTYQWQSRTGTSAFADLSGATTTPYTVASQTTATDYRLVATCTASGQSSTSSTVSVAQNAFANCYCTPAGGDCSNEYIRSVTLNTLSNAGSGCSGSGGYTDYTTNAALTTTLAQGSTYSVTLNLRINSNPAAAGLWLDYDHSGTFDASEFTQVYSNTSLSGANDVTGSVSLTIPTAALTGATRLRVRSANSSVPLSAGGACQNNFYGEVEDYLVTIAPPACAGTPPTATASASTASACANAPFMLGATGLGAGTTGLTYQWQSRIGTAAFANLSGATTNPYQVSSQAAATDYRLVVTCTNSNLSSLSNVVSVSQSSFLSCYATPVTSDASTSYIRSVSVNGSSGFTNTTNGAPANGYNDFTASAALTTTLTKGSSYPLTITVQANAAGSQGGLWLDFDHSATFDAGEYFQFGSSSATGTAVTLTYTLSIPNASTVLTGPTRLRIRWRDGAIAPTDGQTQVIASGGLLQKTTANWNGETEDYLVTLADAPLPVQLVSFTAAAAGATVRLDWTTASELHSDRFEVERSLDGAAFGRVGAVAAAGTSATTRHYAFLDETLPVGAETLYYRLRQVDVGGPATYSPVRAVPMGSAGLAVFPNPAHSLATLTGAGAGAPVQVLDVLGRVVLTTPADAAGRATLQLPAGLADGLYLVRTGDRTVRLVLAH